MTFKPAAVVASLILATGTILWVFLPAPSGCDSEVMTSVAIENSNWTAKVTGKSCGFGLGGDLRLLLEDNVSKKQKLIAQGDDIGFAVIHSDHPRELEILMPNRSNIILFEYHPIGIDIEVTYLPRDDLEDRTSYFNWRKNPSTSENVRWYCDHVLFPLPDKERAIRESTLAYTYFLPHGSRSNYCKQG